DRSVQLIVDTGASAQNLFIKGQGGDIHLDVKDEKGNGAKNIPIKLINSASTKELTLATNDKGEIDIKNTLKTYKYDLIVDIEDFIADSSNQTKYTLWDATLPDNSHKYINTIEFNMNGINQKGAFNIKPRNEWGVDGIVAIDQNNDGIYGADTDTGALGMNVELYYPGTTTKVLGTKTITTSDDGLYRFKDLAVASYDIKVTNVKAPYIPLSKLEQNIKITDANNQTSGPTFLLKIDPNDSSLSGISGQVFVLSNQFLPRGPDSGKPYNILPVSNTTYLETPVDLYQYDDSTWKKIATQTTNKSNGLYQFRGLAIGKDYKVVINESGIDLNSYIFVNDSDGKSTSTSPKSRSSHKGKVKLSNGTQANIAPKEIIVVGLGKGTQSNRNFWYSPLRENLGTLNVESNIRTANLTTAWGGVVDGVSLTHTATTYMKVSFYEEDGVTPLLDKQGTPLAATLGKPGSYGVLGALGRIAAPIDHAGLYTYKIDDINDEIEADYSSGDYILTIQTELSHSNAMYFKPKKPNTLSGYVYLNNSHSGALGDYNPDEDTAIKFAQVSLYKKQSDNTWNLFTNFGTNQDGYYNFTNLPDGQYRVLTRPSFSAGSNFNSQDIELENNDQNTGVENNQSVFEIKIEGGKAHNKGTNFWYKLKQQDYVVRGKVYLDTYSGKGKLEVNIPGTYDDLPLFDATVLLCKDNNACVIGGQSVIASKKTGSDGLYKFTGADGLTAGKDFIVKALRKSVTAVENSSQDLAASHKIRFDKLGAPIVKNFLMQGKGNIRAMPVNDMNGDRYGSDSERGTNTSNVYYWDKNSNDYQYWGKFWTMELYSLPEGKYRIVHTPGNDFIDIADVDPATPPGTLDFEVLADGSLANNLDKNKLYLMQAQVVPSNTTEAISGKLYLDVTGSKNKDGAAELTKEELIQYNKGLLTVSGIFTPRIYPGYFNGNVDDILDQVDFIDKNLQYTGEFAYTAANSTRGKLYLTNMLLRLTGLDTTQFELVGNSGQLKGAYLPTKVQTNLEYMQVAPSGLLGAPDQYWLVKLKNDTEISGRLYYDYDDDGFFTPGTNDVVISGVTVELYRNGELYAKTKTDKSGLYNFKNLFNDTYTVKVTEQGLDKQRYELKSVSNTVTGITIDGKTPKVTGDNLDFIYKKNGDAAITGHVMVDINNNGTLENYVNKTGDMAIPDINVKLYKFDGSNRTFYREVKTNAKGYYSFSGIDLNTDYIVEIEPTKDFGVIANAEGNTNINLKPIHFEDVGKTVQNQYFLLAGSSNSSPSAGINSSYAINSGISGKTLLNGSDPVEPITQVLIGLRDANNNEIARQYTNDKGEYHFYNLSQGKYSINIVASPDGYSLVKNSKGTTQPIDTLSGLDLTNVGIKDNNFYFKQASDEGIGGKIYVDYADNNTDFNQLNEFAYLLDSAITYTVELRDGLDGTGKLLMTQQTVDGEYHFSNLVFGDNANYSVVLKLDANADHEFKQSSAGNDPKHIVIPVANLPKKGSLDNNYLLVGKLKIDGYVWVDENDSKDRQGDEGLNGINVTLNYQAPGATDYVELKKVNTDTSGHYQFEKLPKGGNYQIKVSTPEGTELIADTVIAGNSDSFEFKTLKQNELDKSSAYKYIAMIKGHVSIDIDNSRTHSAIDADLSGLA
ncbi:SdrD B-like domain-containing protein, partial [Gilliamella sp. CG35]|uniref:SdrD B-like domain-containing protein n=1 Tax=Gilliamella sp. CG35 TaxID=3351507 RepID=UPI0039882256